MFRCDTCNAFIHSDEAYICLDCKRRVCYDCVYIDRNGETFCIEGSEFDKSCEMDERQFFYWCLNLYQRDMMFHFDDYGEMYECKRDDGTPLFTKAEYEEIGIWLDMAFSLFEDPFEIALCAQDEYIAKGGQ